MDHKDDLKPLAGDAPDLNVEGEATGTNTTRVSEMRRDFKGGYNTGSG